MNCSGGRDGQRTGCLPFFETLQRNKQAFLFWTESLYISREQERGDEVCTDSRLQGGQSVDVDRIVGRDGMNFVLGLIYFNKKITFCWILTAYSTKKFYCHYIRFCFFYDARIEESEKVKPESMICLLCTVQPVLKKHIQNGVFWETAQCSTVTTWNRQVIKGRTGYLQLNDYEQTTACICRREAVIVITLYCN